MSWQPPPNPQTDATFWIVVLDKRTQLNAAVQAVVSPRQDEVGLGSHGDLQRAVRRYPWLRGITGHEVNGTWWTSGNSVYVSAADATPVTFAVIFPAVEEPLRSEHAIPTAPIALSDLLVALVNMGPDGQIYWAQRLLG